MVLFFFCPSNFLTGKNGSKFAHTCAFWHIDFIANFALVCLCEETVVVSISSVFLSVSSELSQSNLS